MSDESPDASTGRDDAAPGAGAGDAAHTTQIPRIERPGIGQGSSASSKKSTPSKPESPDVTSTGGKSSGETDKGRPRTTAESPVVKSPVVKTPAAKKSSTPTSAPKPSGGPTGRPLTASDYARTTSQSPSTTAVIPAVTSERSEQPVKTAAPTKSKSRPEPARQEVQMSDQRGGRAATLRLSYVEPWSVTRMAFAISVAMMVVAVVAVAIFWLVLEATGVWGQIDGSVTSVLSDDSSSFRITDYLGFTRLVGLTLVLSALNVVIATVLATIAAHLYNLAAQLLGGFQVTYTSED